jgi:cob(I)alamin adenosyltransferase
MKSIVTKRGDAGWTDRLFGGQAWKGSLLIEAIGSVDELNAWIGLATEKETGLWTAGMEKLQEGLIAVMGELSASDKQRYREQFPHVKTEHIEVLEMWITNLEKGREFKDWANPASNWDIACRVCRRAERAVLRLHGTFVNGGGEPVREEIRIYLNRLSDYLWILGRKL